MAFALYRAPPLDTGNCVEKNYLERCRSPASRTLLCSTRTTQKERRRSIGPNSCERLKTDVLPHKHTPTSPPPGRRRNFAGQHYMDKYGVEVPEKRVVVTTGSSGAFPLVFITAFDVGDRVAVASSSYPCYRNILNALGTYNSPLGSPAFGVEKQVEAWLCFIFPKSSHCVTKSKIGQLQFFFSTLALDHAILFGGKGLKFGPKTCKSVGKKCQQYYCQRWPRYIHYFKSWHPRDAGQAYHVTSPVLLIRSRILARLRGRVYPD